MKLTLEINGHPECEIEVESGKEVYAAANAWIALLARIGKTNYSIYKTFQSDANNKQQAGTNNGNAGSPGKRKSFPPLVKVPRDPENEGEIRSEFQAERKAV